jgi:hypothetical protein
MGNVRTFTATPISAAQWHPWGAAAQFVTTGVPLGPNPRTGKLVVFDPWMMKKLGVINSLIFLILGQKGFGKSTLLKVLVMRLVMLQAGIINGEPQTMRIRMHDRKRENGVGENQPVIDFLWGENIALNQSKSINLVDPYMGMSTWDMLDIMVNVCEHAIGHPLVGHQMLALQTGIHKLNQHPKELITLEMLENILRKLDISDIDSYFAATDKDVLASHMKLLDGRPDLQEQIFAKLDGGHFVDRVDFQKDSTSVSEATGRVLSGDYGGIFGGNRPVSHLLGHRAANWDWSGVGDKPSQLIAAMQPKWQVIATEAGRADLVPHGNFGDENSTVTNNLMHMRFWAESVAKARAYPTADFQAMQYLHQLSEAGSEGSEIRALAGNILRGVECYFLGHLKKGDEAGIHDYRTLGVSDQDIDWLQNVPVGCFGILVPGQPMVTFQLILTQAEADLVQSDSANDKMVERLPVLSDPAVRAAWDAANLNGHELVGGRR